MQLDGPGFVETDRNRQAPRHQGLIGKRRRDRLLVADAVLEAPQDGSRVKHKVKLLDRIHRVVALDRQEHVIEWTARFRNRRPGGEHGLIADLTGGHHPDAPFGDGLDVRRPTDKRHLAAGLGDPGPQQRPDGAGPKE